VTRPVGANTLAPPHRPNPTPPDFTYTPARTGAAAAIASPQPQASTFTKCTKSDYEANRQRMRLLREALRRAPFELADLPGVAVRTLEGDADRDLKLELVDAALVPPENSYVLDSLGLQCGLGWQVFLGCEHASTFDPPACMKF